MFALSLSTCLKACCLLFFVFVCFFLHSIALIWPSEWQMIQKLFVVDKVIKITRIEVGGVNPSEVQYISEPGKFACYSLFLSLKVDSLRGKGRVCQCSILWQTHEPSSSERLVHRFPHHLHAA